MPRERPFVPGQVMNRPEAQGFLDKIERDTEMWTTKREQAQAAGNQAAVKAAEVGPWLLIFLTLFRYLTFCSTMACRSS